MVSDTQAQYIGALVKERHAEVIRDFDGLLNAIAKVNQNQINNANLKLRQSLGQLKDVIAQKHWPNWLVDLSHKVDLFATKHTNGLPTWRAHLDSLMANYSKLKSERWHFEDVDEPVIDIDAIIKEAQEKYSISDIYEKAIEALDAILSSGEIDSVKATSDLNELINSLRRAKRGSFSAQVFTWRFVRVFVPKIFASYAKSSTTLGPLITAFKETADELDVSLDQAAQDIGKQISAVAQSAFRTGIQVDLTNEPMKTIQDKTSESQLNKEPTSLGTK